MVPDTDPEEEQSVLRSKRNATRYQILSQIAERQPAVSQQEIADEIGVTAQAVSDYLQDLVERDYVRKLGRGRYEVTNEGVDWLISRTEDLREYITHVSEDVIGQVDAETAIADEAIEEGERVTVSMRDGILRASTGDGGNARAVAVTSATAGQDVGITDFEGVLEYDLGTVTVVSIPRVQDGGSATVDARAFADHAAGHDLLAAAGTEALVTCYRADLEPDVRFGTADAVTEAATKGLTVLLAVVTDELSRHTDSLRDGNIGYEVVDAADL
ncbi:MarR family transcriptional regulator [Haloarchaeobius sp. HRN-SO-5]|uniref:DUF7839 domain-containing protein n=1 Tax=Haloarchaeobius sp. HRN-SO-5 TaxID=3446118 RepID=UPI003EBB62BB